MRNPRMKPLRSRLTQDQLDKRAARIIARRQVAEQLHGQMGSVVKYAQQITEPIRRGFFGRLKWLLFGK